MAQTKNAQIRAEIDKAIFDGLNDKRKIYDRVVENLGFPRPFVRRAARDYLIDLQKKVEILEDELDEVKAELEPVAL